ncbi:E3 ubiquitin-protein ligase SINA-like 10 [Eutrema salsugineum]|uniref:E3 ubiquitin-protein ligase SINA-like 10 n=1 Tax=Eutrema salsugineum TaxID=72664 RepID=UPI000CED02B4|nr:E3 ubiquitin-protein ligase SINA-like 10 [Eutrema salsugineum]
MEKVIASVRVSSLCPNAKYGCKENVTQETSSSHEEQCVFAPCYCPVGDCNYTGSHKDLKNHVNDEHKEGLIRFEWDTPLGIEPSGLSEKITILREKIYGELIVIRGFKGSDGMLVSVSCIAPLATEKGRLSCSLELRTSRNTLKHMLIVKAIQKTSEEQPKEDFVLIPSYMIRLICSVEICVSRT